MNTAVIAVAVIVVTLTIRLNTPMVVMTVAAKMTALGQFQLLKVLLPVMVTPWPAASDTT